jgi:hypothetical protein
MAHSSPDKETLKRAWQLARAGNHQQARILIRAILEEDPNNADAWFIASQLEPIVDRQRLFLQKAIVANPNHRKAREALAALEDQEPFSELYALAQPAVKKTQSSNNRPSASDRWRFLPWWIAGVTIILFVVTLLVSLILLGETNNSTGGPPTPNPSFIVQENEQIFMPLGFRVVDAEYSSALDQIVAVSEEPYALHIFDPTTHQDRSVSLSNRPTSVSVSPNGLYAAVGQETQISYIDLGATRLVSTLSVVTNIGDVVLGDNGWVYAIPVEDSFAAIHAIEISSNRDEGGGDIYAGSTFRMHPSGQKMYGSYPSNIYPADTYHATIGEDGTITAVRDSIYHGEILTCYEVWISSNGLRLFTACGTVIHASDDSDSDMTYYGTLKNVYRIISVDDSPMTNRVLGIVTTRDHEEGLGMWNYESFVNEAFIPLPNYVLDDGQSFPVQGRYIFVNSAETEYYVLGTVAPEAGLINDFGLIVGKICIDPYCQ